MGFKKIFGILILLILVLAPMVFALDTSIQVKTKPNYAVTIRALKIDGTGTLEDGAFLDQIADENGYVSVTYSSDTVDKIDISLMVKNALGGSTIQFEGGPVQVFKNNEEHIKTGWPVEIDTTINPPILVKFGKQAGEVVEENVVETPDATDSIDNSLDVSVDVEEPEPGIQETSEEIEAETKTGITGKSISFGKSIITSKITFSIFGVLILALIMGFVFRNKFLNARSHNSKDPEFKVLPKESLNPSNEEGTEKLGEKSKLKDAEEKLEEARKELEEVKQMDEKEEKIRHAKEIFERDKAALEELEKE